MIVMAMVLQRQMAIAMMTDASTNPAATETYYDGVD